MEGAFFARPNIRKQAKKGDLEGRHPKHSGGGMEKRRIQLTQEWNPSSLPQYNVVNYCTLVVGCDLLACLPLSSTTQGSSRRPKVTSAANSFCPFV